MQKAVGGSSGGNSASSKSNSISLSLSPNGQSSRGNSTKRGKVKENTIEAHAANRIGQVTVVGKSYQPNLAGLTQYVKDFGGTKGTYAETFNQAYKAFSKAAKGKLPSKAVAHTFLSRLGVFD